MDPLSITASVVTLIDAAAKVYRLLQLIRQTDTGLSNLCAELQRLAGFLKSIDEALQNCRKTPLALAHIDRDLWEQADVAMEDCKRTLNELEAMVHYMNPPNHSNTIFKKATVAAKLYLHSKDVILFREKIHMSSFLLQTLLQVITVSLSLRSNASQELVLLELKSLNRSLQGSYKTATSSDSSLPPDESRVRIAKHLEGFVRVARGFYYCASTTASSIGSGRGSIRTLMDNRDTESIISPSIPPITRERIQMFLETGTSCSVDSFPPMNAEGSYPTRIPTVDLGDSCPENNAFNNIVSVGLTKVAQRALQQLEFEKADEVLTEALKRHKSSGRDNEHQRRLRTKFALSSLLQGKCRQAEDLISSLIERGMEDDVTICQLLYALALLHLHNMNFEAAQVGCEKLFKEISERGDAWTYPGKNDILTLLAITYRLSGKLYWAEAIEAECTNLKISQPVPNVVDFIASCPELRTELFGLQSPLQAGRSISQMKQLHLATDLTLLQLRSLQNNAEEKTPGFLLDERMQNAMKKNTRVHTNLSRFMGHLRGRQSLEDGTEVRNEAYSDTESMTGPTLTNKTPRRRRTSLSNRATVVSWSESQDSQDGLNTNSPISRIRRFRWDRLWARTRPREQSDAEENFEHIMSWIKGTQGLIFPISELDGRGLVFPIPELDGRALVYEGNRSAKPYFVSLPELDNTQLVELPDTSPRVGLGSTGISPPPKSSTIPSLPDFYKFLLPVGLGDTSVPSMNIEHVKKGDPNNSQAASTPENSPTPDGSGGGQIGGTEIPNEHATPYGHKRAYSPEDRTSKRPRLESLRPCNIATNRPRPRPFVQSGCIQSARRESQSHKQGDLDDKDYSDYSFDYDGREASSNASMEQVESASTAFPPNLVDGNNIGEDRIGSRITKRAVTVREAAGQEIPLPRNIFRYRPRSDSFHPNIRRMGTPLHMVDQEDHSRGTLFSSNLRNSEGLDELWEPPGDGFINTNYGLITSIGPSIDTPSLTEPYRRRACIGGIPNYPYGPNDITGPTAVGLAY